MSISRLALASLLALLALAGACGPSEQAGEEAREQVREALEAYLPLLAASYATGEVEQLRPYAAEKELLRVRQRVEDLALEGRRLEASVESVTVESFNLWNYSNALASTVEVWNLTVYATGSDVVLGEERGQVNRVKYQLKRDGDEWRVLFRELVDTVE